MDRSQLEEEDTANRMPKFHLVRILWLVENRVFATQEGYLPVPVLLLLPSVFGDAPFPMLPTSAGIVAASTYSLEQYLQLFFELVRNSYSFSRKTLVKIAFLAIDLYIFRWYALYEATGDAPLPMLPNSTGIVAASTYSLEQYLQLYFELVRNSYSFSRKTLVKKYVIITRKRKYIHIKKPSAEKKVAPL